MPIAPLFDFVPAGQPAEGAVDPLLHQSNGPQTGAAHRTGVSDRQRQLRALSRLPWARSLASWRR